jgi:hypothetical protein
MRYRCLCGLALALAGAHAPAMAAKHLQFLETDAFERQLKVAAPGDTPENYEVFKGVLHHIAGKAQAGTLQGFCLKVTATEHEMECSFTVSLADGHITVQGTYNEQGESTYEIVGGTGAYRGVKGSLRDQPRNTKPYSTIWTLDLE